MLRKSCTETPLEEVVVHTLTLVVLQIGKRCCLNSDVEAPATMRSKRNPDERHLPTVQISCNRYRSGRKFSILYIESRSECNTGLWREVHTTIETDCLRHISFEARGAVIHIRDAVTDDIVKSDIPRYREVVV